MAVKKSKKTEVSAKPAKAEAKETAPKKTAKKAAAPKAAAPATTPASTDPSPAPAAKAAPKKAAKKAAAPVKLSASQGDLLKKVGGAAETGYALEKKAEQRSIDSLLEKKLIKKGAKDKATGIVRYHVTSSGKKHTS